MTDATGEPYTERQGLGGACWTGVEDTGGGGGSGGGGGGADWGGGCCLEGTDEELEAGLGLEFEVELEDVEEVDDAEGGVWGVREEEDADPEEE